MTDFNTPTNTTTYSSVLSTINSKIASVAKMVFSSDTNIPTGTLQYNRTTRVFEEWSGSTWVSMRVEQAGVIKAFGGTTAPAGHVMCDGTSYNTYTYRELHKIISNVYGGTAYNAGVTDQPAATTTFNVPNLKGRFPLGKSDAGTGSSLGATGGEIDHAHTVSAHYHEVGTGASFTVDIGHTHAASSVTGTVGGASDGLHTHTVTDPGHTHSLDRRASATAFGNNASIAFPTTSGNLGTIATDPADTKISINSTNSGHSHTHSLTATGQTLASTNKSPTAGSKVGTVTGGVDGNQDQLTDPNNPPFQVVNYIITV